MERTVSRDGGRYVGLNLEGHHHFLLVHVQVQTPLDHALDLNVREAVGSGQVKR